MCLAQSDVPITTIHIVPYLIYFATRFCLQNQKMLQNQELGPKCFTQHQKSSIQQKSSGKSIYWKWEVIYRHFSLLFFPALFLGGKKSRSWKNTVSAQIEQRCSNFRPGFFDTIALKFGKSAVQGVESTCFEQSIQNWIDTYLQNY